MSKEPISSSQLIILIIAFSLGSSLALSSTNAAVRSGWIAEALGMLEGLLIAVIYATLSERFHHQSLVQIAERVFGRILGLFPALLFVWFMLQLGGLVLRNFGDYFEITVLQRSPASWFIVPLTLAAVYAGQRGIGVLARVTTILLPISVFIALAIFALLLPHIRAENVLPLIDVNMKTLLKTAHSAGMFPYGETVVFLMVLPHLSTKNDSRWSVLSGLFLAGLLSITIVFRNSAVLGGAIENTTFPSYSATRLVDVGEVFSRIEILTAVSFLSMGFVKVAVLIYGAATGLAQALRLQSHEQLVLPLGLLMIILAVSDFEHGFAENLVFVKETWPYYAPLFAIGLPLFILLTAIITRQPREGGK